MFNVGKYARALPSLLTLRERGSGPREFSEVVQGTLDLRELYLLEGRETVSSAATGALVVGVNFPATALVVPAGELWFVHLMNTTVAPGAGAQADIAPAVVFDGTTTMIVGNFVNAAATQQARAYSNGPFVATPGSQFGLIVRSVTLAPVADVSLLVTKLRI